MARRRANPKHGEWWGSAFEREVAADRAAYAARANERVKMPVFVDRELVFLPGHADFLHGLLTRRVD